MAEPMAKRRSSRLSRSASAESTGESPTVDPLTVKSLKCRVKKPKERWLLTRKTWRYMADAGRKLIPDGAQNRHEDVPKIEAHFQDVCKRETRFLLWRKNSYPGALGFRKSRRKSRPCGVWRKASSADEALDKAERPKDLLLGAITSGGRFDIQKMKYDFLNAPVPTATSASYSGSSPRSFLRNKETFPPQTRTPDEDDDEDEDEDNEQELMVMLKTLLEISGGSEGMRTVNQREFDVQELVEKLQRHLTLSETASNQSSRMSLSCHLGQGYTGSERAFGHTAPGQANNREVVHFQGNHVQKSLQETLSRYFSQSASRDRIVSDLLTNRKALQKLYFDLQQTKRFRRDIAGAKTPAGWDQSNLRHSRGKLGMSDYRKSVPPPLIEIQGESTESASYAEGGTQTRPLSEAELAGIEEEYRKAMADRSQDEEAGEGGRQAGHGQRRRSSVDHDDVSQSVSDHIKRYLRMARKKSTDADKADRFKRVNYDRNLRNIRAKGETTKPGDDDGLSKGCQTNEEWAQGYREQKLLDDTGTSEPDAGTSSTRSSIDAAMLLSSTPTSPTKSSSFLGALLHKHDKNANHDKSPTGTSSTTTTMTTTATATTTTTMQKSKSSSSVVQQGGRLMAKTLWKRSKSQSRAGAAQPCTWTPKGSCSWNSVSNGRQVVLADTVLQQLSDIERKVLQKVALAKLQALNLGTTVKVPTEAAASSLVSKPKRRPYLLKRKALTTGIFDAGRKDEKDKQVAGMVFGIPLAHCVENDRVSGRLSAATSDANGGVIPRTASRTSFSSLNETATRPDEKGSSESLSQQQRIAESAAGLLDELSTLSGCPIAEPGGDEEQRVVPHLVSECVRHLDAHGLRTLGLFRVSPSKKRVRELRESFDSGKVTALSSDQCPHDVATLLKEFLRDLPDPLLCRDLYNAFAHTQKIRNRRLQLEALQHLVQLLPAVNRDTLAVILEFLARVAAHAGDECDVFGAPMAGNKMDAANLATVFAPNILHSLKQGGKPEPVERHEERLDVINVVRTMIDNARSLFAVRADLLDEVYVHMMDTHPAALEELLNKRESTMCDESQDDISDGSVWSSPVHAIEDGVHKTPRHEDDVARRKTYSREAFLHESTATGSRVAVRMRHKERNLRRRRDGSRRRDDDSGSSTSSMAAMHVQEAQTCGKTRSSSLESASSQSGADDRRRSSAYAVDPSGIITASLTIRSTLRNDGEDIPFIEDEGGKMAPMVPPRRRQRSVSDSDSSIASAVQPITGSISLIGYDSAIGSSHTHNTTTTTPSSSMDASGVCSSPPSWASTPPTSPDGRTATVNYIPDDPPTKTGTRTPLLQKVSITSTTEVQRAGKPADIRRETPLRKKNAPEAHGGKFSPSITSIGDAVMRSRTADLERISGETKMAAATAEKTKYAKRRYTDLRHTTRHIPDADALEAQVRHAAARGTIAAAVGGGGRIIHAAAAIGGQTVYKRRELISSAPAASR